MAPKVALFAAEFNDGLVNVAPALWWKLYFKTSERWTKNSIIQVS